MPTPELRTPRQIIAWSYANLACAHAALSDGRTKHRQTDWMIRAKLFRGLCDGAMRMGGVFDDERLKLVEEPRCAYCGDGGPLTIDHLLARAEGGTDAGHNLVRACRPCNSSKGKRDLLVWYESRNQFPPLMLLRRYLKLAAAACEQRNLFDRELTDPELTYLPFALDRVPTKFPPLKELRL